MLITSLRLIWFLRNARIITSAVIKSAVSIHKHEYICGRIHTKTHTYTYRHLHNMNFIKNASGVKEMKTKL